MLHASTQVHMTDAFVKSHLVECPEAAPYYTRRRALELLQRLAAGHEPRGARDAAARVLGPAAAQAAALARAAPVGDGQARRWLVWFVDVPRTEAECEQVG